MGVAVGAGVGVDVGVGVAVGTGVSVDGGAEVGSALETPVGVTADVPALFEQPVSRLVVKRMSASSVDIVLKPFFMCSLRKK